MRYPKMDIPQMRYDEQVEDVAAATYFTGAGMTVSISSVPSQNAVAITDTWLRNNWISNPRVWP